MNAITTAKNKTMSYQAYCEAKDLLCNIMLHLESLPKEQEISKVIIIPRSNALSKKAVKLKK